MLLNYWQQELWRTHFNDLPLSGDLLTDALFIPRSHLEEGRLEDLPAGEHFKNVWIAPFVAKKQGECISYWIPLWIPAQLQGNQLSLRKEAALPWFPASQFDSLKGPTPFSAKLHQMDERLREELEENLPRWQNWQQCYQACAALLAEADWQNNLQAFYLMDEGILFEESALISKESAMQETPISCLHGYLQIEDPQPQPIENIFNKNMEKLAGLFPEQEQLLPSEYEAALQILSLKETELLALQAPLGTGKEAVLKAIMASYLVNATLSHEPLREIALLTADPTLVKSLDFLANVRSDEKEFYKKLFSLPDESTKLPELLFQTLQQQYDVFATGLHLTKAIYEIREKEQAEFAGSFEEYLSVLQEEDEAYEQQFETLLKEGGSTKETKSWWSWFSRNKAAAMAEAEQRGEKIRQLKVQRTKIHQEIADLAEHLQSKQSALGRWRQWCEQYLPSISTEMPLIEAITQIQHTFGSKLYHLAICYWQVQKKPLLAAQTAFPPAVFKGWYLFYFDAQKGLGWQALEQMKAGAHLIVIDQANRLLGQQVAPFLTAQRALFLGDEHDLPPWPVLSPLQEEILLAKQKVTDNELLDQLQYKGMLSNAGNAFKVALINQTFQKETEQGLSYSGLILREKHAHPLFIDYLNTHFYKKTPLVVKAKQSFSNEDPWCGFQALSFEGKSEKKTNDLYNPTEAEFLVAWLTEGLGAQQKEAAILTPFAAQKDYLKNLLVKKGLSYPVYTFGDLPAKQWDYMIFSSVYSSKDQRPFVFDQGDHLFYALIVRARKGVWICGDPRLFDPRMHSPSGKLAKILKVQGLNS